MNASFLLNDMWDKSRGKCRLLLWFNLILRKGAIRGLGTDVFFYANHFNKFLRICVILIWVFDEIKMFWRRSLLRLALNDLLIFHELAFLWKMWNRLRICISFASLICLGLLKICAWIRLSQIIWFFSSYFDLYKDFIKRSWVLVQFYMICNALIIKCIDLFAFPATPEGLKLFILLCDVWVLGYVLLA